MNLLKKAEPQTIEVKGHVLKCPVCNNEFFWRRGAFLNTAIATFFKLDWISRNATCFVCSECTHISWFAGQQ
jgi:hypothetical protein